MILNMDKIQFESRAEIGTIIKALEDWQEDHGKDETVQELINKLDIIATIPVLLNGFVWLSMPFFKKLIHFLLHFI